MSGAHKAKVKLRAERQETLREYLSERGKVDYVFKNLEKMEEYGFKKTINPEKIPEYAHRVNCLRIANEQRLKLMNKYLPDLKAVEVTGDAGGNLKISVVEYGNNDTK